MSTPRELANAIRALSMDAVQRANSGHPGMPMGMADIAEVLWRGYLQLQPAATRVGRPRSLRAVQRSRLDAAVFAVLHLTGYPLTLEDLKSFRQLGSKTPGHPEHDPPLGIETTTGPLGQGLANAVGMALAEKLLGLQFNRPGFAIVDHYTYAFCGDGCLMEGISHEACSLAGTLGLGKLIVFYDDNGISIDGKVVGWFTDDTPERFAAYGWHVVPDVDGLDAAAVEQALRAARAETTRPSLICCKTIIGFGAPDKQGTKEAHGEALGVEEVAAARKSLGWPYPAVRSTGSHPCRLGSPHGGRAARGRVARALRPLRAGASRISPGASSGARAVSCRRTGPISRTQTLEALLKQSAPQATRQSSQAVLNVLGPALPELLGGSADLTGSNNTLFKGARVITPRDEAGDYLHYGVREFGMTAIMNGIALHGGLIPYGGTFLVFSDYARNAVRLACLMQQRVILVYTHDSIGLGEDGPTHQPIEHLCSLRAMPHMSLWRPCDAAETAVAWTLAHRAPRARPPWCSRARRCRSSRARRSSWRTSAAAATC